MRALCLFIAAASLISSPAALAQDAQGVDANVYSSPKDEALLQAVVDAQRTLPQFRARLEQAKAGSSEYGKFGVKVSLETDDGRGLSRFWVTVHDLTDTRLRGWVNADVPLIARYKRGSQIEVPANTIVDWQYEKNGKAYGHFSTRAMMLRANAAQRAQAEAALAPTALEPEQH